ncbi:hypothetical protein HZA42_03790 [Candidatus Peregrinibacteria bacterium]|nr:hypothetical protein [Candidatus Peregrinibacteria bacterium]
MFPLKQKTITLPTNLVNSAEKLINLKIDLGQKITDFERKGNDWLEPCRQFILDSREAKKIALSEDKEEMKNFIKKIGSNFILKGRAVQWRAKRGWRATTNLNKFCTDTVPKWADETR